MAGTEPTIYLLSSVKDEGPFILEFVAHHLVLGFSKIIIASNDCTDGSTRVLESLARAGRIHHVPSTVKPGQIPQHAGYAAIRRRYPLAMANWVMVLDVDEFLNVHIGDNSVAALVAAAEGADIIALNSATFGAGGETHWRSDPVTEMFRHRFPTHHRANSPVKCLTKNPQDFKALHNHSAVSYRGEAEVLRVMCGDGGIYDLDMAVPLWRQLKTFPPAVVSHDLAQYNHYATKTYDTYCLRRERGRGAIAKGVRNDRHDDAYYLARAGGAELDDTISRYRVQVRAKMAELLADPVIAQAQKHAERKYGRRVTRYAGFAPRGA